MKKITTILITVLFVGSLSQNAQAGSNGANGFILGAGGGALIGQAIGRDTEATLLGTAIGSMLGYVIGNEHDKYGTLQHRSVTYRPVERRYRPQPRKYYSETRFPQAQYRDEQVCRESEVLATIDGRPEKIFTTVCLENGKWVIASDNVQIDQTIILEDEKHHHRDREASWKHHRHGKRDKWQRRVKHHNRGYRQGYRDAYLRYGR